MVSNIQQSKLLLRATALAMLMPINSDPDTTELPNDIQVVSTYEITQAINKKLSIHLCGPIELPMGWINELAILLGFNSEYGRPYPRYMMCQNEFEQMEDLSDYSYRSYFEEALNLLTFPSFLKIAA